MEISVYVSQDIDIDDLLDNMSQDQKIELLEELKGEFLIDEQKKSLIQTDFEKKLQELQKKYNSLSYEDIQKIMEI